MPRRAGSQQQSMASVRPVGMYTHAPDLARLDGVGLGGWQLHRLPRLLAVLQHAQHNGVLRIRGKHALQGARESSGGEP